MSEAKRTTDHDTIRAWAERRDGTPSVVAATAADGKGGLLRIDFGEPEDEFEAVEWDEFFRIFDDNGLAFLYQEDTDDRSTSRFNKFVARDAD